MSSGRTPSKATIITTPEIDPFEAVSPKKVRSTTRTMIETQNAMNATGKMSSLSGKRMSTRGVGIPAGGSGANGITVAHCLGSHAPRKQFHGAATRLTPIGS
jgi:hypothetical protein